MSSRIVVTGMGIITAIGRNITETFDALRESRTGVGPLKILDTIHRQEFMAGEVQLTHQQLIELAGVNAGKPWTRTALLAVIAASEAYHNAGLKPDDDQRTALISATTVGGMDRSELMYKDFLDKDEFNPFIDTHHAGNSTEMIAEHLDLNGIVSTVSTACSSSLNSIMVGARLIKNGYADRVIVGGTDALSKFTVNGFNSLMILDREHCRPFDDTRMGLNLGEGAAYLVLERESRALRYGKHIHAVLSGYANANDAFHQTASSEEGTGPYLSMQKALQVADLQPGDIDYINVHGTGTDNNDLTEGRAMKRLFGDHVPEFSSTKAFTGHTLGAAGAVEAIFSILTLQHQMVWPNINFRNAIPELKLKPITKVADRNLKHVLTNSFGFGGNDSSIIFSSPDLPETLAETQNPKLKTQNPKPNTQNSNLKTQIFINGTGAVAPQETLDKSTFLDDPLAYEEQYLQVVKPEYRSYIDPKVLRRMSKIVRMGIVAAKTALEEASIDSPDAILTGTGMGCQADTEKFLNAMLDNKETLLNPTAFIQSTHNTVGAQIALMTSNHNYNLSFVHRAFSFESALLDSMMLIKEGHTRNVLVGGIDEITEESWKIKSHIHHYSKEAINSLDLLKNKHKGTLAGESASFFVLGDEKKPDSYAEVLGVETLFRPKSTDEVIEAIRRMLYVADLNPENIDMVMMGYNGDGDLDHPYHDVENTLFPRADIGYFKHLCGEHDTASAFATWIAARILKEKKVPSIVLKEKRRNSPPERILIYNHFRNINHSMIIIQNA